MHPILGYLLYLSELASVMQGLVTLFALNSSIQLPYAWKNKILGFACQESKNLTFALTQLSMEKEKKFIEEIPKYV